jgi:hypothetical protein
MKLLHINLDTTTQKGNPQQLTVCQHTFPLRSISRFAGDDGRVEVYLVKQRKVVRLKPDDQLFCAKRVWDQRAESSFMKEIEDKYQSLAELVVHENKRKLNADEQQIVTDMFAIWNIREHRRANPIPDQNIQGIIDVARHYTKDDQEILEKNHIGVIRPDLTMAGRHIAGPNIQLNLFEVRKQMSDAKWGVLKALEGQFIVPDNFSNARILPLTPSLCFFSQSDDDEINKDEVARINKLALDSGRNYYFSRELTACPQ